MSTDCIFCKIVAGEIPCTKVYEDETTMAFMDIGPVVKGHTLVIPKEHHDPITEVPDAILSDVIITAKKIARAQKKGLNADGINVTQANGKSAGQEVPHIHFHIIPRFENSANPKNWIPGKYSSIEEMNQVAALIKSAIEQNNE